MEQLSQFVMHHWQLCSAFSIFLILALINELLSLKKKAKSLSPQAAIHLVNNNNAVFIDIRDRETFNKGHIIDAIHATSEQFKEAAMNNYKNRPLILVCQRGQQAGMLANQIRQQGFDAMILEGGIQAWQMADLPLVKKG